MNDAQRNRESGAGGEGGVLLTPDYPDGKGVPFREHRKVALDEKYRRPGKSPRTLLMYRYASTHCQLCGVGQREIHHLMHSFGGAGRSDEACNLIALCLICHAYAHGGPKPTWQPEDLDAQDRLGLLLWAKWRTGQSETDWRRLVELRGSYLPDLHESEAALEEYCRNRRLRDD